jgi:hypothetical protein
LPPRPRVILQTKLKVNAPGDVYEREAERISKQVVRLPDPRLQRASGERVQTKRVQADVSGETVAPPIVNEVLQSPGQALDPSTREFMESRFGADFGRVRVHTDSLAGESARSVNALAFTAGEHVVFGHGQYAPVTEAGRSLLAHELTHTLQQGAAQPPARGHAGLTAARHGPPVIQRKDDKSGLKKVSFKYGDVYKEVKSRNPDLAELITPESISGQKEPPLVKGGPAKNGEEHVWGVWITPMPAGSGISSTTDGGKMSKKVGKLTRVTHIIKIQWVFPLYIDPELAKQATSEKAAYLLSLTEPLYHELLHARLMMERSPEWAGQRTTLFYGYEEIIKAAKSPVVAKERDEVRSQVGRMIFMNATKPSNDQILAALKEMIDFVAHEKYDAQTEFGAFGKQATNAKIAEEYAKTVAQRVKRNVTVGREAWDKEIKTLEHLLVKFYDPKNP